MKMSELQKLTNQIEQDTNRKIKMIGSVCNGKQIVYLYLNGVLMNTLFLSEIRNELNSICFIVNALKYGKNPVEF